MTVKEKEEILKKFKEWFRDSLIANHKRNTEKLENIEEFNINPLLLYYLSNYLEGNSDPKSLAKVLVYPRVLGTSITTSFGANVQQFVTKVLPAYGSTTSGMDIEFIDQIDGRKKYCQLKSGPNAINKDDVKTIDDHFKAVRNLAITNTALNIGIADLVFALVYGEEYEFNSFIKILQNKSINVLAGKKFWHHFTGDEDFYYDLIRAAGEIANEVDMKDIVENVIEKLSHKIEERFKDLFNN